MRQKKAKQIRRMIYGDFSPKIRIYRKIGGTIVADKLRRAHKAAKRHYTLGTVFEGKSIQ